MLAAAMLLALAAPARAETTERWSVVSVAGTPAGYAHTTVRTADDGSIVTETEMLLSIRRGTTTITVTMGSTVAESAEGQILSARAMQKLGPAATTTEFLFGEDRVRVVTAQGNQRLESTADVPAGDWLTPGAAERFIQAAIDRGETEIRFRSFDPLAGLNPVGIIMTEPTKDTVEVNGERFEATRWTIGNTTLPGVNSTEWVDADGETLVSETTLGGLGMRMTRATRDEALAAANATPPELMVATFVRPSEPIRNPRLVTEATYILRGIDASSVPTLSTQRVEPVDGGVRLTVSTNAAELGTSTDADLASSVMINAEDEAVQRLAEQATNGVPGGSFEQAEAARRFVARLIRDKNLTTAFGSASEVARSRSGDCTEHAVLLAAILRSNGIPARVAAGLIYADRFAGAREIFGYHMWTRALVEIDGSPQWVDFDATLPPSVRTDATHITLSETDLGAGSALGSYAAIARAMGALSIEVESITHGN